MTDTELAELRVKLSTDGRKSMRGRLSGLHEEIARSYLAGETRANLARKYGVTGPAISRSLRKMAGMDRKE